MKPKSEPQYPLIDYLEKLVRDQDRGAMAALRRGVGKAPGTAMEMHRYVAPFLPKNSFRREEENYYVVAALFAYWHQGETNVAAHPPDNLGASLARLRTPDTGPSLDLRFTALLKSHRDDLPTHLRQAVGLLKSKENVPVHWRNLYRDLRNWDSEDGWVQRAWAKSFWGRATKTATESTTNDQND
ncbi:MAG: type I-E CRISPR-associated protein Cse2/CasB [Deltaproteobacteria bacterium]|nr:type I-E CRISPR-associated protein Cse2/CasB [Deltaproteobacteria bacterium]